MTTTNRTAFTLVEALVATAVIGVAGATLAAVLGGTAVMRARADADARAAQLFRERIGSLAVRACTAADTQLLSPVEQWRARRVAASWLYSDTVHVTPAPRVVSMRGAVACAP